MFFKSIILIFCSFTLILPFTIQTHNKTITFEGQTLPYFETPATVVDSKEDDSGETDDFKPHEEDDDLNRGAINIRPGDQELIDSVQILEKGSIDEDRGRPDDSISFISKAFTSRKTFSCPKTKTDFVTGTNVAMLNPEDIRIIAAMGDRVATGAGLWPLASIEFRGAAFPIGGDASIDGLVTIPNILREFTEKQLLGVSHGMGLRDDLPPYQLNVAESGTKTKDLPSQAEELVSRLNKMKEYGIREKWIMVIFTIGTEELCDTCAVPHVPAIQNALDILNRGLHKAFVVIVGPLHVSLASDQSTNVLQRKCNCTKSKSDNYVQHLFEAWESGLNEVEQHIIATKRDTFSAVILPFLTITSRYPASLFVGNTTLLNRRGHNYAAKWLWNRLIGGSKYNLSTAILSKDKYFCPSVGCPYFRTLENQKYCPILRHVDATEEEIEVVKTGKSRSKRTQRTLYITAIIVIGSAFCTATLGCTIFYILSKKQTHGRFDMLPVPEDGEYPKPRSNTTATIKKESETEKFILSRNDEDDDDDEIDTDEEKYLDSFRDGGSQILHKLP